MASFPTFDPLELNRFFTHVFSEEAFSCHEMRLSPAEAQYLTSRYSHLKLMPLSPEDEWGKIWFQVCAEGAFI